MGGQRGGGVGQFPFAANGWVVMECPNNYCGPQCPVDTGFKLCNSIRAFQTATCYSEHYAP